MKSLTKVLTGIILLGCSILLSDTVHASAREKTTVPSFDFSPASGPVGNFITLVAHEFSLTGSEIRVNGVLATVFDGGASSVRIFVPKGATTGKISVKQDGTTLMSSADFTVLPYVYGLSQQFGRPGITTSLVGTSFSNTLSENHVKFGGFDAVVTGLIVHEVADELTVIVPAGPSTEYVPVSVTVGGATATAPGNFHYTYFEPLTITTISPASAKFGTLVTLTGTGFNPMPGRSGGKFSGETAFYALHGSLTSTQIQVYVTTDAVTGPVTVEVDGETVTSSDIFTVIKDDQEISFDVLSAKTLGDQPFTLAATATSLLDVEFTTTSDKIQLNGNTVTLLQAGSVTLTATQPGNNRYSAAAPVEQTFCINPAKPTITRTGEGNDVMLTSSAAAGNHWFLNGSSVGGS